MLPQSQSLRAAETPPRMHRHARDNFFIEPNLWTDSCRIGAIGAVRCDHLAEIALMLDGNALRTPLP
ncbi:hypothetical protein [Paraburkholderia aromaticivorans]|uniref:hypothetical protein n=1 Tax=Paraburkholderia aromaticivorans TaxID=2026199 RepID=UPI0014562507|nr:hypothetical protein [Paraburkholderia aromaticivorans]